MFCSVDTLGSNLEMPPPCNKCKRSVAQDGDSWCLGCASLEHCQNILRQPWRNQALRLVTEEALLSSARLARAFSNLDQRVQASGAASTGRAPETHPKSRPQRPVSRSPRRDQRPPLPRSPARAAPAEPRADRESESDFREEEEEEEEEPDTEVKRERHGDDTSFHIVSAQKWRRSVRPYGPSWT